MLESRDSQRRRNAGSVTNEIVTQGEGDEDGPWNSGEQWDRVDDLEQVQPAEDGNGIATVGLGADDKKVVQALEVRTASN